MILLFFNLVGPILLLSAEKRTERSNVYGLTGNFKLPIGLINATIEVEADNPCSAKIYPG